MVKLMGGLGLCLVLCAANTGFGQDPFEGADPNSPVLILPPPSQTEPVIQAEPDIESFPVESDFPPIKTRPYTRTQTSSMQKNTHVRAKRTPAQEAIYQRALYRAAQRTKRMEERKWRNISLLRPDNREEHFTGYIQILPVWEYHRAR